MSHEDYMKLAIEVAKLSESKGGCAIGAVVVRNGKVIAQGMSLAGVINDVAQHGEIAAIRLACEKLKTINLDGCILYGTLEPCNMCLSAALWANMNEAYFGAYADDVKGNNYEFEDYSAEERAKISRRWDGSKIKVSGGLLRDECSVLLNGYKDWIKQP
jgi:guanine deaminase